MPKREIVRYEVRLNSRARRINITVRRDGTVSVTKPRWVSTKDVEHFIARSAQWIARAKERLAALPKTSHIESSKKEYKKYKNAALKLIEERLQYFNTHYHLRYRKIFVRNQKSRWGSCSRIGNLSFNYRLLFLPADLADYVIVHELCHLREMNHGRAFWKSVAETIPDHDVCRKELRRLGHALLSTP